jgi:hypothetical protein
MPHFTTYVVEDTICQNINFCFIKLKKENKMKSLSGEALKALPKELEAKENRLNERAELMISIHED